MKRLSIIVVLALALGMVIAACQPVAPAQQPAQEEAAPTEAPAEEPAAEEEMAEEEMAEDAGFEPDVARGNFMGSPKARGRQDYEGFIEVVHDEETGQMLGGCIVGTEAGEQIQMLTAACQSPRGLWLFTDINYSHPSWCEELEHAIYPYTSQFSQSDKELFQPGIYAAHNR